MATPPVTKPGLFTPYMERRQWLPPLAWRLIRWGSVATALSLAATAMIRPGLAQKLFWAGLVPIMPLLLLVAPGIWRNVCPLAAMNQVPRTLGFTRGLTVPPRLQLYTPLISAGLFLFVIPLRRVILDQNGPALGLFVLSVLGLGFLGGTIFKGKSGWCSQFCPMLSVERLYGQSPLVVIPNSHCRPCVGCSRNCYDFNPNAAYLADLHDESPQIGTNRKLFAGALPWLIVAFFTQPDLTHVDAVSVLLVYGRILLAVAAGIGLFHVLESLGVLSAHKLVLVHAFAAIALFYAFILFGVWGPALTSLSLAVPALLEACVLLVAARWLRGAWPRERIYLESSGLGPPRVSDNVLRAHREASGSKLEVTFLPGPTVLADQGVTLLDVAERNHVEIQSGCRMGMCGADPLRVLEGEDNLSPAGSAERATLGRLGLQDGCRMACSARVNGPVRVSTDLSGGQATAVQAAHAALPPGLDRVVVIGAGAAGVTCAVELKRRAPDLQVTVVGHESYDFYNRMAISKLVSESTSVSGLYLLPGNWPEAKGVTFLRGLDATAIDLSARSVNTEDGNRLTFDRLVIATGANSFVPEIWGFGQTGTFVLRGIDDGVGIQQHIRRHRCRRAVVIGGGLLGLEAAYSILQAQVRVTVLDRGGWPLNRQLDRAAGTLLRQMLGDLGIEVIPDSSALVIKGSGGRVTGVVTSGGQLVLADLVLVAAGIEPNVALARGAGIEVGRGIKVDDHMRTSADGVFAIGDVIEIGGKSLGLWPASVEQAHIAAENICGGEATFRAVVPPTKLKVAAFDVLSVGQFQSEAEGDLEVVYQDAARRTYRKLVLREGRAIGAVLVGAAELYDAVVAAVEAGQPLGDHVVELGRGDWSAVSTADSAGSPQPREAVEAGGG
jgi:nitrite reductase (NADH) large subunit